MVQPPKNVTTPSFTEGALVRLPAINKEGQIERVLKPDLFQVRVDNLLITCKGDELQPLKVSGKKEGSKLKRRGSKAEITYAGPNSSFGWLPTVQAGKTKTLDLHGKTTAEALDMLERAISNAVLERHSRFEVLHGIGSGALLKAIHKHLPTLPVVKSFKLDERNPGVTVVYL